MNLFSGTPFMPLRSSLLGLLCTGMLSASLTAAERPVRFAPEKDYGPFVYVDEKNEVRGLSVDMLAALSQASGMQIETLPARSLSDILAMAERGEVDLISSLRPTPERAKFLNFSSPYVSVPAMLLTRADTAKGIRLADLNGKHVAVGKGYAVESFVRERYPDVQWIAMPDDLAAIRALLTGKVDGVVADIASIGFVIRQNKMAGLTVQSPIGYEYALSFGYSKQRPDIGEALERGLRSFRGADRERVTNKWMEVQTVAPTDTFRDIVKYIAVSFAIASLAIMIFRFFRRRQCNSESD